MGHRITPVLGPNIILLMIVFGVILSSVPYMVEDYKKVFMELPVYHEINYPPLLQAYLCGIFVVIPIAIDLVMDLSSTTPGTETFHWISRFILLFVQALPCVVLWITGEYELANDFQELMMHFIFANFRFLGVIGSVLYYLSNASLKNSIFNVFNCLFIFTILMLQRFFGVLLSIYPGNAVYYALNAGLFCVGVGYFMLCIVIWYVVQNSLKSKDQRFKSNYLCSKIYLFTLCAEAPILMLICYLIDGTSNLAQRSGRSMAAMIYAQIFITVMITTLPGRVARREHMIISADHDRRRAFTRYIASQIQAPLDTIASGLNALQSLLEAPNDDEQLEEKRRTIHDVQLSCAQASEVLHRLLKEAQQPRTTENPAAMTPLMHTTVRAVPFLLQAVKKTLPQARLAGIPYTYDMGCNDRQDSILPMFREIFLQVDEPKMTEVLTVLIANALKFSLPMRKMKFQLEQKDDIPLLQQQRKQQFEIMQKKQRGGNSSKELNYSAVEMPTSILTLSIIFRTSPSDAQKIYQDMMQFKFSQVHGVGMHENNEFAGYSFVVAKEVIELHGGNLGFYFDDARESGTSIEVKRCVFYVDFPYKRSENDQWFTSLQPKARHPNYRGSVTANLSEGNNPRSPPSEADAGRIHSSPHNSRYDGPAVEMSAGGRHLRYAAPRDPSQGNLAEGSNGDSDSDASMDRIPSAAQKLKPQPFVKVGQDPGKSRRIIIASAFKKNKVHQQLQRSISPKEQEQPLPEISKRKNSSTEAALAFIQRLPGAFIDTVSSSNSNIVTSAASRSNSIVAANSALVRDYDTHATTVAVEDWDAAVLSSAFQPAISTSAIAIARESSLLAKDSSRDTTSMSFSSHFGGSGGAPGAQTYAGNAFGTANTSIYSEGDNTRESSEEHDAAIDAFLIKEMANSNPQSSHNSSKRNLLAPSSPPAGGIPRMPYNLNTSRQDPLARAGDVEQDLQIDDLTHNPSSPQNSRWA